MFGLLYLSCQTLLLPYTTYKNPQNFFQLSCNISVFKNISQILYIRHVSGLAFNRAVYQQLNLTPVDREIVEPHLDRTPRNISRHKVESNALICSCAK